MQIRWPIGTEAENIASRGAIPARWVNSNPFLNWYEIKPDVWNWHDGVDLNNNWPTWNADYHSPIYAPADGLVTFAGIGGGSWGHIINIKHLDRFGRLFVSGFGHIENPIVKAGDEVRLGQQIASVGNGDGFYAGGREHLHFRISTTNLLLRIPNQWSGTNKIVLLANFVDPVKFIKEMTVIENPNTTDALAAALSTAGDTPVIVVFKDVPPAQEPTGIRLAYEVKASEIRVVGTAPEPNTDPWYVVKAGVTALSVRPSVGTSGAPVAFVSAGYEFQGKLNQGTANSHTWAKITSGQWAGNYVAQDFIIPKV